MKLMLVLLGAVAALTYGAVTLIGAAPVGSVTAPVELSVPAQTASRAPASLATVKAPQVAPQPPVAAPPAAQNIVTPNAPSQSCDSASLLSQLRAARKGHRGIAQIALELDRAGCPAGAVAAVTAPVEAPNSSRGRAGDHSAAGEIEEGDD